MECLPSGLVRRWLLSGLDEKAWWGSRENHVQKCAGTITYGNMEPHCMLFHRPSCKDQMRFKEKKKKNHKIQGQKIYIPNHWKNHWLGFGFFHFGFPKMENHFCRSSWKKKRALYENHEKIFLPTHTFFFQSPSNNACIFFYAIYWHSSLSWQR